MSTLSADKRRQVLSNIYKTAQFDHTPVNKPKVFLVDDQETVNFRFEKHNLSHVGIFEIPAEQSFRPNIHTSLVDANIPLNDLNWIVKKLRSFGMTDLFVIVAKAPSKERGPNPPFLFVLPNWGTFDLGEYAFECRSLIVNQENG